MKISEAASRSGLSADTIRFYEKSRLLPAIARRSDGNRSFTPENIEWLVLLSSLRKTGMPMKKMQQFAKLYQRGNDTIPERKDILLEHAEDLEHRRAELDHCAELLAYKLARYDAITGD